MAKIKNASDAARGNRIEERENMADAAKGKRIEEREKADDATECGETCAGVDNADMQNLRGAQPEQNAQSGGEGDAANAAGADNADMQNLRGTQQEQNAQSGDEGDAANAADADTVAGLQKELKAERDKYLRLAAEYDNFRKRSIKERETRYGDARADTITRLLPVYDNLERALKMECTDEAFYKGIELTMTQLAETLENMGVTKIQAVGEPFDPNRHNAVMTVENPDLGEKIVADEYQKGFALGERVIRFSTVVVAN